MFPVLTHGVRLRLRTDEQCSLSAGQESGCQDPFLLGLLNELLNGRHHLWPPQAMGGQELTSCARPCGASFQMSLGIAASWRGNQAINDSNVGAPYLNLRG